MDSRWSKGNNDKNNNNNQNWKGKKKKEAKQGDVKQCVGDKLVAGDDLPLHDNIGDNRERLNKDVMRHLF